MLILQVYIHGRLRSRTWLNICIYDLEVKHCVDHLLSWWFFLNYIHLQKDNVSNQREHLILLLANVYIRQFPKPGQQPKVPCFQNVIKPVIGKFPQSLQPPPRKKKKKHKTPRAQKKKKPLFLMICLICLCMLVG